MCWCCRPSVCNLCCCYFRLFAAIKKKVGDSHLFVFHFCNPKQEVGDFQLCVFSPFEGDGQFMLMCFFDLCGSEKEVGDFC